MSQSAVQAASAATAAYQRGSRLNTAASYPAIFSVQWLLRRWVLWRTRLSISWQRLAGGWRAAQPIHGKLCFCTRESPWQFSVLTQCAWPIRWQFPSPHRNHSGHRHHTLLISKSLGNEVPWANNNNNNNNNNYCFAVLFLISSFAVMRAGCIVMYN